MLVHHYPFQFLVLVVVFINFIDGVQQTTSQHNKPESLVATEKPERGNVYYLSDMKFDTENDSGLVEPLMYALTLNGRWHCINTLTGQIKWSEKDSPIVSSRISGKSVQFIPNAHDGSLYVSYKGKLQRYPYSIPELVARSPSHCSEGYLYSGSKKDSWITRDIQTGKKQDTFTHEGHQKECPVKVQPDDFILYSPRTEFQLSVYDSHAKELKFQTTYIEYTAYPLQNPDSYMLDHVTSPNEGKLITVHRQTQEVIWQVHLDSPIVGIYQRADPEVGIGLQRLPLTFVSNTMYFHLSQGSTSVANIPDNNDILYIAWNEGGLFTLPVSLDDSVMAMRLPSADFFQSDREEPVSSELQGKYFPSPDQIYSVQINSIHHPFIDSSEAHAISAHHYNGRQLLPGYRYPDGQFDDYNNRDINKSDLSLYLSITSILAVVIGIVGGCVVYTKWDTTTKSIDKLNELLKERSDSARIEQRSDSNRSTEPRVEISSDGEEVEYVGKITIRKNDVLGRGSSFVFRGTFEGRPVAVKRVDTSDFSIADREVKLLRMADQHVNVVRYFCQEKSAGYRYIALELADRSLDDFVLQGGAAAFTNNNLSGSESQLNRRYKCVDEFSTTNEWSVTIDILRQAVAGLLHLHRLAIVHRDIKPHNYLIVRETNPCGIGFRFRVLLSDFGLCKQMRATGYATMSGCVGTVGWMAPECMAYSPNGANAGRQLTATPAEQFTSAMDVFSCGLVIYYVLSGGQHPFGDILERQARIQAYNVDYYDLHMAEKYTALDLIRQMLARQQQDRLDMTEVATHPLFWSLSRSLRFIELAKNRVDTKKLTAVDEPLKSLEDDRDFAKGWFRKLCQPLQEDLRKQRTYNPNSVNDLLRAVRNKAQHWQEVSSDVKDAVGDTREQFYQYFHRQFPQLLIHCYRALRQCRDEHNFNEFYYIEARTPNSSGFA